MNFSLIIVQINDIVKREKLPIIVGGTNYYIESVLYHVLIDSPDLKGLTESADDLSDSAVPAKKPRLYNEERFMSFVNDLDNEEIFRKLKEVDPETADTLHPNNRRKTIR